MPSHASSARRSGSIVLEFRVHAARDRALNARFRALHHRLQAAIANAFAHTSARISADELARIALVVSDGFALQRAVDPDGYPISLYESAAAALMKGFRT
jgi:hypothetical protein